MKTRGLRLGAVALAALLVLSGCGDDDDEATTTDDTTESAAGADSEAFCNDLVEIQQSEPEIPEGTSEADAQAIEEKFFKDDFLPQVRRISEAAPAEIQDDTQQIVEIFEEKGPGAFEDEKFAELNVNVNTFAVDECGAARVDVTAKDYAFTGIPATVEAGPVGFFLANEGKELHEMVLFRKKDGTTESFDELLEMDEAEAEAKIEAFGGAFAFPGKKDVRLAELEAGDYAVVCFVPVGTTPDKAESEEEPSGPPHFTKGMKYEFKVA